MSHSQYTPNLGHTPEPNARRDAVHIAVAPVVAGEKLMRGHPVAMSARGEAAGSINPIGIVDPFREEVFVERGERFWLFLYPGTITGLRHVWTHPAFAPQVPSLPSKEDGK